MKYSTEIIINKSLDQVVSLFANVENYPKWQKGLISQELISGKAGDTGAITKLVYQMGKKEMPMEEKIIVNNLPSKMELHYKAQGVFNSVSNRFEKIDNSTTKYLADHEFQFSGFIMKLFSIFMPGAFKKESLKHMKDFKEFAEMS